MTKVYFEPIHLKTYYIKAFNYKKGDLPITEEIAEKILTIPLYPTLNIREMDYIITEIGEGCR
jgi:perosamine synthetase